MRQRGDIPRLLQMVRATKWEKWSVLRSTMTADDCQLLAMGGFATIAR